MIFKDDLEQYMVAPGGEGPLAQEYVDKPHRLIYDLVNILRGERVLAAARERAEAAKLEHVQTNLRHWREECAKLHGRIRALELKEKQS